MSYDAHQYPLPLAARSTDEILRDRLTAAVCEFNEEVDPAKRVELHAEIKRLRTILGEAVRR